MKTPAPADDASSKPARKRTKTRPAARRRTLENTYSDPALRERLKEEIRAAAKGGEPGTWSARKSQLLTLAYQKTGGGYVQLHPNSKPKEAKALPNQAWQATDGKPARRATSTTRYPPKKAWSGLSSADAGAAGEKKKLAAHTAASPTATKRVRKQVD